MKKKYLAGLLMAVMVCGLTACGSTAETAAPEAGAEESGEAAADETAEAEGQLEEYKINGVATLYLPAGFVETESGENEAPLPQTYVNLYQEETGISVWVNRFGEEAYKAAGVPLPANIEEYSQREGTRSGLPDGQDDFDEDSYGNLYYMSTTEDGSVSFNALSMSKAGDAFGAITVYGPADALDEEACGLWCSRSYLE